VTRAASDERQNVVPGKAKRLLLTQKTVPLNRRQAVPGQLTTGSDSLCCQKDPRGTGPKKDPRYSENRAARTRAAQRTALLHISLLTSTRTHFIIIIIIIIIMLRSRCYSRHFFRVTVQQKSCLRYFSSSVSLIGTLERQHPLRGKVVGGA